MRLFHTYRKPLGFQDLGAHLDRLLSEEEPTEDGRGKNSAAFSRKPGAAADSTQLRVTDRHVAHVLEKSGLHRL